VTAKAPKKPGKKGPEKSASPKKAARNWVRWLRDFLLTSLGGTMVFMSFPNYDLYPLQWFSLIPILAALKGKRPWPAFGWGLWAGTVTNCGGFYWLTGMLMDFGHFSLPIAIPICILMCAYQGLVFAMWAGWTAWLSDGGKAHLLWISPLVWVIAEYLLPFIFPWYFGNGQYLFYPVIQICELTGVMGLSFLVVFVSTGLYQSLALACKGARRGALRPLILVGAVFLVNLLYGVVRIDQVDALTAEAPKIRIGMVEADVGIFEKAARNVKSAKARKDMLQGNILKHHLLAKELEETHKVDLIVQPESSFISAWARETVRFKRGDLFALAAGEGRHVWQLDAKKWSGPRRAADKDGVIRDIYALREDAVFAVGDNGLILRLQNGGTNPRMNRLDYAAFTTIAVGEQGAAVIQREGEAWKALKTGVVSHLRAVRGSHYSRVYAVGDLGVILRWNGKKWRAQQSGTTQNLRALWVAEQGKAVAVGDSGTVVALKRRKWRTTRIGTAHLNGVAGYDDRVVAVGDLGAVWERRSGRWKAAKSGTKKNLNAVSADGDGVFYAVGDGGTVLRRDFDGQWRSMEPLRKAGDLHSIQGIPYTEGHALARESRHVFASHAALPSVPDRLAAAGNIGPAFKADRKTRGRDWSTPLRDNPTPVLLGLLTYETQQVGLSPLGRGNRRSYNSAMLLDGQGQVLGRYDKTYLLIFGEFIPFGEYFPQFYEWLPEASHFYPGTSVETFAFEGHQLGVMICYEDILPSFARKVAGKDPNVLINVTNDAWFGKTSEPYLHLALSIFRTVENRLWLVRSTNTGVSAFVDAVGRVVQQTRLEDPEILVQDVPMLRTWTPYREYGDLFAYACFIVFAVLAVPALARRRKKRRGSRA
jgi:apolipoprotein N-acyltransferase/photosystem II stability/assembly factor-like uncharacterized protein